MAAIVMALVGGLVTFGLHRISRKLDNQDEAARLRDEKEREFQTRVGSSLDQQNRDIGAISRKLKMRRQHDGQLA